MPDRVLEERRALEGVERQGDAATSVRALLRRSSIVLLVLLVGGGVALVAASRAGEASEDALRVDPPLLAAAVAVYTLVQVGLMEIWRRQLRELHGAFGAAPERTAWAVSQLGKYVPTGAALFVVRVVIAGRAGGSRRIVLSSSLYEFGCSFLAALAITAAAVGSLDELDGSLFRWVVYAIPLPLLIVLMPPVFLPVANAALRRAGREPLSATLGLARVFGYTGAYAVTFLFAGLGILALSAAVADVSAGDVPLVLAAFSVGYVASVLGFVVPAGIGVRESGMALALATIMPTAAAVSVAVVSRLVQVGVECAMAAVVPALARRRW
jgi:hypothetical protein